ncbi:DUF2490 domain-containing protein [Spirosoma montaniterrae]|uniref:DUF2490 domain-containing protein n=1 Tax=Spirosoma montaniterrae TaxID=1178516 RepID=UPI001E5356D2|nr:DUF2490 domain-containing protein [Spirosoma montaniterrae]
MKTIQPRQQAWFGYLNQTRFSTHWGTWTDIHFRRTDFLDRASQNLYRVGLTYYVADQVRLTAGYAYIQSFLPTGTIRPEHRPWQQIWWAGRVGRINATQWIRLEQRFNRRIQGDQLRDGYTFNWRFRYNLLVQMPLWGTPVVRPGVPNVVVQNELFVNAGKEITYNVFDQNRLFAGLSYPVNKHLLAQVGYMNQYVQLPAGNTFNNNHTLRLFIFHNLDFRKQP